MARCVEKQTVAYRRQTAGVRTVDPCDSIVRETWSQQEELRTEVRTVRTGGMPTRATFSALWQFLSAVLGAAIGRSP